MKAKFDKLFLSQYKKADVRIRNQFDNRLRILVKEPTNPQLRNHALRDKWHGHRSIDVTADWRAIYREIRRREKTIAYFVAIGTHKDLYK